MPRPKQDGLGWQQTTFYLMPVWTWEPSVGAIESVCRQQLKTPSEDPCTVTFHAAGLFNKVYLVHTAERSFIMRVTLPVYPRHKTRAEVVTLRWVRENTSIPVPKVFGFDDSNDNEIGFEWILMEYMQGASARKRWRSMSMEQKVALTERFAVFQFELSGFEKQESVFKGIGTLDSPEIDLQVNSKASQSTAAPGRLVSTEFFMEKSEDEDDIEDAEDILPVAQSLLALLPKIFPPGLTRSESSALQHHDLNLNNILVNEQGEVTAVLDWECVSALPLWMLTQMPKFLDGEPREDEPQRDIYADETPEEAAAEADKRNDPDYLDNEGKNELYWIHKMEYEQTQLRKVYRARLKELCPVWAKESPLENDFYEAVSQCDGIWKTKIGRWADRVEKGESCLVKVETAQSPRYIALSYVWGGVEMLKTTSENLEELLQPGALIESQASKGPKLARTIVDAMDVARKLGCPFFWTDCICIVQGPGQEENDERAMFLNAMASIYADAYLTIVAAEGADGNYGLPGIGRCSEPRDTLCSEMRYPDHTLSSGPYGDLTPALYCKGKTWSTRGWTFQESYLSRRLLVFTSIVSFHCQKHTSCEWDLDPHGTRSSWIDRTSFICNVPYWPNIDHYIDVVREYVKKNLTFDDDTLDAFAGVTAVLNKSFHPGFHYGLPEVFFDASLLWEPDWDNATPPQLRKTHKLVLPSWSWVRTRGSIQTRVWKLFAEDFYKDTSFEDIYELYPRVQWWKIGSQGRVLTPIKYQHFSNHASMPPGWNPPIFQDGDPRFAVKYSHTLSPATKYPHPFPFQESANVHLPDVKYGPLLRCIANRGWLIKSTEWIEKFRLNTLYGTFNLCLSDGTWAGILFDDRLDQGFPQEPSEKCEVIAIAEGRVPGMYDDYTLPENVMFRSEFLSGGLQRPHRVFCYEFYFILWIGWVDGIAYRRGIGRVLKGVWEKMELEEIEVTLG
ncbi:phosphotransferase enzyme family domain-containing protein [Trichoderma sp. SZMC 28015]